MPMRYVSLALSLLLLLGACVASPPSSDVESFETVAYEDDVSSYIRGNVYPTMYRIEKARLPVGGETATVELYIDTDVDDDGDFLWDDGQLVTLLVRVGEGGYVLVAREFTQGMIDCVVIEDLQAGGVTILTTHKASAGLTLRAYCYDEGNAVFAARTLYETEGNVAVYG